MREFGYTVPNTLLMHPKDKVPTSQKKDIVYHWECQADRCSSSYIGETSRSLGERVKEHSKSNTSAILKHCTDFHHPLALNRELQHNKTKTPLRSLRRPRKPYTFEGWIQISTGILVKCLSHTVLTPSLVPNLNTHE